MAASKTPVPSLTIALRFPLLSLSLSPSSKIVLTSVTRSKRIASSLS